MIHLGSLQLRVEEKEICENENDHVDIDINKIVCKVFGLHSSL